MISLTIRDTKAFMSHLLIKDTFDRFWLSEASLSTANTYTINGEVNRAFYTQEEFEALADRRYSRWESIRPFCFQLIKGSKVPSAMKYIFVLPDERTVPLLESCGYSGTLSDISGLFLNIKYGEHGVTIVTGTALRIFTMDKTLEHAFDHYVKAFLDHSGISYEEET